MTATARRASTVADVCALGLWGAWLALLVAVITTRASGWFLIAGVGAVAASVGGLVVGARHLAFEEAERPDGPTVLTSFVGLVRRTWTVWAALALYEVAVLAGAALHDSALAVAVTAGLAATVHAMWQRQGVERQIFLEAAGVAFFVLLAALGVVAVVGASGRAAVLAPWGLYLLGLTSWAAAWAVRSRQLR